MNKYETGSYHLHLFDRHGTKTKTMSHRSYIAASRAGEELTARPPYASYAVTRVIINSLDTAYPWHAPDDAPRFDEVSCSQCGKTFGPGNHGYSHCEDHREREVMEGRQKN